jgi:c-di-GMP-binding flagellar brake protein YcgR
MRPGLAVSIIINIDYRKEVVESKNSIVHDVIGDKIIIAQTDPPISRTNIDKEIYVTYLDKEGEKPARYGFPAKIIEFVKEYELAARQKTQVIILLRKGLQEQYNLRMFYRLEPPSNCGIDIFVNGSKVNILDISIGGASFSHNKVYPFKANENASVILIIGERASQIMSKVVRVWQPDDERMKKSLEFVSIQFLNMNGHIKNELGRKIRDVERALRYKEIDR